MTEKNEIWLRFNRGLQLFETFARDRSERKMRENLPD